MSQEDITERACDLQYKYTDDVPDGVPLCDKRAKIVVHRHTEKEILQDDGSWKKEPKDPEYYCRKHFDHIFLCHPFYSRIYQQFTGWEDPKNVAVPLKLEAFTYSEYKVKRG